MTTTTSSPPDRVASVLRLLAGRVSRLTAAERYTVAVVCEDTLRRSLGAEEADG